MKILSEYLGKTLILAQTSYWKCKHELKDGDKVIASYDSAGIFTSRSFIEGDLGNWEFYRPGFWKSSVAVREAGKELPIASYECKCFGGKGTVNLPMGGKLFIVFYSFKRYFEIQNEYGERLVLFTPKFSWGGEKTDVVIEKKSELVDKYPWVIMLVCYLAAQRKKSHAAAVH